MTKNFVTIDGNYAAAHIAYAFSEVAAIYPITPSSNMGEYADEWAAKGKKNMFGQVLKVVEMQSEGGAAGAVHGSLTAGSLTTTFTASQGLLLMIPNMYKISGEMLPAVFHVSARALAAHALSIFGDHSDVMGCRMTGWAMLASSSIQEVMDLSAVAHMSTLEASLPFLSFFDGFRTSHEVQKVEEIDYETLKELVNHDAIRKFRDAALKPEKPYIKTGAQNPDVYFQGREAANKYYNMIPEIVQNNMDKLAAKTGRKYNLFDYYGAPDAEKVIIMMGSGAYAAMDAIDYLTKRGEKVGLVNVHLYRPFSVEHFLKAMPKTVKKIAVLDRTKEPGSIGEPLYMDVKAVIDHSIFVIGGRYGLSSKEFTPSMVKAVYDHLDNNGWHGFTVGINDDVTNLSIKVTEEIDAESEGVISCKFWGLGSDGTVSANKDAIKIIGDHTDMFAQGYFSYDSKKSGGITISHLRFGKQEIRAPYLVSKPNFVACHNASYIGRYDILEGIKEGGTFVLNSEWDDEDAFNHLTKSMQKTIIEKNLRFYNVNALKIAKSVGLGGRINTVMQVAFFKISKVIPIDDAMKYMKKAVEKTFGKKGQAIVEMNWKAIDGAYDAINEINVPKVVTATLESVEVLKGEKTAWITDVVEPIVRLKGDDIPVSKMPVEGKMPLSITKMEKRSISPDVIKWVSSNCIQCNQCSISCPHAAIRPKQIAKADLVNAPETFKPIAINKSDLMFKIQVYPEDCTGCGICAEVCPGKGGNNALVFSPLTEEIKAGEIENAAFFDKLPENLEGVKTDTLKGSQFKTPLFEFSGACAGCGETPYVKLVTQLFGDRMVVANATGCSSIYGGTFPSSPYTTNAQGFGPGWANSLFEDNAEYGMGFRLAVTQNRVQLLDNVKKVLTLGLTAELQEAFEKAITLFDKVDDEAKAFVKTLKPMISAVAATATGELKEVLAKIDELKDYFVNKSVWIFGGDGWAYDIGYGGLDHVIASGENVNILILDTEVYSNTGGQASKSTPIGSIAKFAASGKVKGKKNLGLIAMSYGYVYVAQVSLAANRAQVVKAMIEAEKYDGPSIVIAYSPCIAHGFNLKFAPQHQIDAVKSGYWPIYRFNPELALEGKNPLQMDNKEIKASFRDFILSETRYKSLPSVNDNSEKMFDAAEKHAVQRFNHLKTLSEIQYTTEEPKKE